MFNKKKIAFMASLILSGAALAACGGTTPTESSKEAAGSSEEATSVKSEETKTSEVVTKYYTFTFEANGGSAVASQQIEEGKHATAPEDPTKDGYVFDGWYKEATFATIYDFETEVVTSDTTVYANWVAKSGESDLNKAIFYYNYDGAPNDGVYQTKEFQDGAKLRKPSTDPTRAGYSFGGWYMEPTCETEFKNNTVYTGDQAIYAQWSKTYTLEAEDTQLTGFDPEEDETANGQGNKIGHGISSDFSGVGCIGNDPSASNGKAVHGLYYYGAYLDFEFTSDKATTGALTLRMAAEFRVVTLTAKTFKVQANGTNLSYKYGEITLNPVTNSDGSYCGDGYWDNATAHSYEEVMINSFDIKEGENKIRLLVNNDEAMSVGTCQAYAPIIDCIKINSTSSITMKVYDNK